MWTSRDHQHLFEMGPGVYPLPPWSRKHAAGQRSHRRRARYCTQTVLQKQGHPRTSSLVVEEERQNWHEFLQICIDFRQFRLDSARGSGLVDGGDHPGLKRGR